MKLSGIGIHVAILTQLPELGDAVSQRILIVTPAPRGSRKGNRVTAERWEKLLRSLGHVVDVAEEYAGQKADVLVALHARKSARSIARFHIECPHSPLFVVLTGTDLYHDLRISAVARHSLELASRLILLQPEGARELLLRWRRKSRIILQSAIPPQKKPRPRKDCYEICVVGHLRPVKDPFRAALAARRLPAASRVRIVQIGGALTTAMDTRARREMEDNPRFVWLGELSHDQTRRRIAQCRALVLSSKLEGGANVISEAIVAGVPVLASRIAGSIGLLGRNYPGFFDPGDTRGLTKLLHRVETDASFLKRLTTWCNRLRPRFAPEQEAATWRKILAESVAR